MRKRWGVLIAFIVIGLIAFIIGGPPLISFLTDQARVQAWITSYGALGPLVLIGMIILQTVLSISPISLLAAASAYVFGFWGGVIYSGIGMALGSSLNMILGRKLGRPFVEKLIDPKAIDTFDRFNQQRGPLFYFIVFVMPWVPDDLACYSIGLSRLPLRLMSVLAAIGRLPSVIVQAWLVTNANTLPPQVIIGVVVGGIILALGFYRHHRKLETWVIDLAARLNRKTSIDEEV
jgi:uncharacterized membrane protein YdjX (TVP38/TMEM64 family)